MKSKLAKAVLTAAAALALAGAATPAFAHVGVAGGGEIAATADEPFLALEGFGLAHAGDTAAGGFGGGAATATDLVGGGVGFAHAGDVNV
ncbi:hypothetical protein AB0E96_16220 [Kitasatospora sp. NPDC036755]|uniref:hypothetical protein n=1 Tax=Kitasatospora sp. NPDC036755 TaxID=3154600 RepID=UPI003405CD40